MAIYLSIAAVVVLALLATSHRAYRFRRSRLGAAAIAGGWVAVAIGALLGPAVSGAVSDLAVDRATPLLSVGLGWIGVMVGLQARRDVLTNLPRVVWRLSLLDMIASVLAVGGAVAALFAFTALPADRTTLSTAVLLVSLLAPVLLGWSMETRSLGIESMPRGAERAVLLRASGGLSALIAITFFGVATALIPLRLTSPADIEPVGVGLRLAGVLAAGAIGVVLAIVAKEGLRLAGKRREEMLVVFLGIVGLAAGISADLGVSPLFPAMLTGATFANLRTAGPSDAATDTALFGRFILQAEHIVAVMFALLAGILLTPRLPIEALYVAGGLILARLVLKPLCFAVLDRSAPTPDDTTRAVARAATIRQSPVALALAVSLCILTPDPDVRTLLTVVVIVGFSCDLLAALAARRRLDPKEAAR
ncbi:MAG: hypothetical protein ACTS27_01775 [Phycisphaerales bacterium]